MRIQHNIMAMNAYRNYSNNTAALSKNLEKLSSGYKINRAGDDAAGLAISEKMRAQITGLSAARKNVKDGISLVKTAEGAMQEIQDMLNRMDYLATQSANGTYDDPVDRKNLQKEVNALKDEINRIADSANFNGIKLLDGSLAKDGTTTTSQPGLDVKMGIDVMVNTVEVTAQKGKVTTEGLFGTNGSGQGEQTLAAGDELRFKINYNDAEGNAQSKTLTFKLGDAADDTALGGIYLVTEDDAGKKTEIYLDDVDTAGKVTDTDLTNAIVKAVKKDDDLNSAFTVTQSVAGDKTNTADGTAAGGGLTFESRGRGSEGAMVTGLTLDFIDKDTTEVNGVKHWDVGMRELQKPNEKNTAYDLSKVKIYDFDAKDDAVNTSKRIEDCIIEVNGEKFVFVHAAMEKDADTTQALRDAGITHWVEVTAAAGTDTAPVAADVGKMADKIAAETGLQVVQGTTAADNTIKGQTNWTAGTTGTEIIFRVPEAVSKATASGGLTLQIGDTADKFNQLNVSVGDMHTKAMGTGKTTLDGKEIEVTKTIADIDISSLEGAQEAIGVIKNAINYVSEVRGDLGAVQNRLEHTAKNLSVMTENIQDAESTIRDTDVAEEMMAYTKNNILIQSAQAMLAQANAVPQGVLQLLG